MYILAKKILTPVILVGQTVGPSLTDGDSFCIGWDKCRDTYAWHTHLLEVDGEGAVKVTCPGIFNFVVTGYVLRNLNCDKTYT